jgi:MFS family permease
MMGLDRLPRHVWSLSLVSLLSDISVAMIHAVLPIFIITTLNGGALTVGIVEGIAAGSIAIMRVFSGGLSDILRVQKGLAVFGYALSAATRPFFAIAIDPLWVMGAQLGDWLGQGIAVAPRKALMAGVTPQDLRSEVYRLRQSWLTVGACIGPIIAGVILFLSKENFPLVFSLAFIPSCMAVALLVIAVKPVKKPAKLLMVQAEMTGLLGGTEEYEDRSETESAPQFNPVRWRDLPQLGGEYWLLLVVAIVFNLGNSSDAFLLLRSAEIGIMPPLIPVGLVIMNIVWALVAYPITKIDDRVLKIRILLAGFLLHAVIYFGVAVAYTNVQIWCLFALYGLHLGMTQGLLLATIEKSVPNPSRGTAISLFNLAVGVTLLIANPLAGFCWQAVGSGFTFAVGAFFAFLATLILLLRDEGS